MKVAFSLFSIINSDQLAVLLTECWTADQILTECFVSISGYIQYVQRWCPITSQRATIQCWQERLWLLFVACHIYLAAGSDTFIWMFLWNLCLWNANILWMYMPAFLAWYSRYHQKSGQYCRARWFQFGYSMSNLWDKHLFIMLESYLPAYVTPMIQSCHLLGSYLPLDIRLVIYCYYNAPIVIMK